MGPISFVWVVAMGDHPNDHPSKPLVWSLARGEDPNEDSGRRRLPGRASLAFCSTRPDKEKPPDYDESGGQLLNGCSEAF